MRSFEACCEIILLLVRWLKYLPIASVHMPITTKEINKVVAVLRLRSQVDRSMCSLLIFKSMWCDRLWFMFLMNLIGLPHAIGNFISTASFWESLYIYFVRLMFWAYLILLSSSLSLDVAVAFRWTAFSAAIVHSCMPIYRSVSVLTSGFFGPNFWSHFLFGVLRLQ